MGVFLHQKPSPNYNDRPFGEIDTIVLHADSAPAIKGSIEWCRTPKSKLPKPNNGPVSYHIIVGRLGDAYQLVEFDKRAWSNGPSVFMGRSDVNDFSISIAFGNKQDKKERFTEAQYQTGSSLVVELMKRYPKITLERITTHAKIATPKGRKNDPEVYGPFDVDYFMDLVKGKL
jgi:AmpD protein